MPGVAEGSEERERERERDAYTREDVGGEDGAVGSAFNSRSVTSEALRH